MILGEGPRPDPVFQLHPWRMGEENRVPGHSNGGDFASYALSEATVAALRQFLAGNEPYGYLERRRIEEEEDREEEEENDTALDAYSCDEFRMYEFKVRRCVRGRSHDWTECPYAHPGEKARRRDPRKFNYSGVACPDFRKGACKRGDACEYAHGVFECWLHPSRYRTQACKDGTNCRRRVCFFAHTPDQLRAAPQQPQSPPPASPPMSPISESPINDIFSSMRRLHLSKANSVPSSWGLGSPRGINAVGPGFCSLPATPTAASPTPLPLFDDWSEPTERVESGRSLRVKIYGKLSREFSMRRGDEEDEEATAAAAAAAIAPDVGWVSDLLM